MNFNSIIYINFIHIINDMNKIKYFHFLVNDNFVTGNSKVRY